MNPDDYTLVQDWTPCPQIETVDRHARRVFHAKRCADIAIETLRAMMRTDPSKWVALAEVGEALTRAEVDAFHETNRQNAVVQRSVVIDTNAHTVRLVIGKRP